MEFTSDAKAHDGKKFFYGGKRNLLIVYQSSEGMSNLLFNLPLGAVESDLSPPLWPSVDVGYISNVFVTVVTTSNINGLTNVEQKPRLN
ncbi:hypothetical protein EVAR_84636_1 [Eumeta japonica]|uniref:Uncharacterized protein n=1 Tax=Eumeta variegata TaxID=151549 RepID=A0A4C1V0G0_EUMVA|nr:hypothetical protein EVAR_84636_1 [Eumeta japonica]